VESVNLYDVQLIIHIKTWSDCVPRYPDPDLERNILDAAVRLWARGGQNSLTIRALAREAGTTTPTLYERYRDREAILRAVRIKAREQLFAALQNSASFTEAARRYLRFAQQHRHAFSVLFDGVAAPPSLHETWPTFNLFRSLLARRLGGTARQHTRLMLAIWATLHGAAELINHGRMQGALRIQMENACLDAIEDLQRQVETQPRTRHSGPAWPRSLTLGEGKAAHRPRSRAVPKR
jgi:AcrR family transcriptional regulator